MAKFIKILYIPVALLCLALNIWMLYYQLFLKDNTLVIHTNFVDEATYTDDEKFFMEINIYNNVIEWKWNYYVDTSLPTQNADGTYDEKYMFSTGVQFYKEPISKKIQWSKGSFGSAGSFHGYQLQNYTFYSQPKGINTAYVSGGVNLANQNAWIWDIGGNLCAIQEIGAVFDEKRLWVKNYDVYDSSRLIAENTKSAKSCLDGTTITTFDFSRYFKITMADDNGKFTKPIEDENILKEWTFMTVKVTKSSKDMISSKQSLFKSYKGNPNWNADGTGENQTYWVDETVKNLTVKDCRYIDMENGIGLALKKSCMDYLSSFDLYITLTINLDDIDEAIKVIGFADKPFGNLKIDKIKITSTTPREFKVPANFVVESEGVTIIGGGVNV